MKKIAITGGLSVGKSTVCQYLIELGAYVVSADEIVHNLLYSNTNVRQKVVNLLGQDVLVNNQLNREAIAEKVFSHPSYLRSLESILHPLVWKEIESRYQTIKDNPTYNYFVAEVPLLYETQSEALFDVVVVVLAEEELCKKRFSIKKKHNTQEFAQRMLQQLPQQEKAAKAHYILLNNGNLAELKKEVLNFASKLQST